MIDSSRIRHTTIILTFDPSKVELPKIQERSRAEIDEFNRSSRSLVLIDIGRGYAPEDITEAGEDVTSSFITGPPGHGDKLAVLAAIRNNPTISAIVGGLILAGLVFFLGWK